MQTAADYLRSNQTQLDMDGTMVGVSAPALDEVLTERDALLAALKAVEALNHAPFPTGNLDAAIAYRQIERDVWKAVRDAIAKASA